MWFGGRTLKGRFRLWLLSPSADGSDRRREASIPFVFDQRALLLEWSGEESERMLDQRSCGRRLAAEERTRIDLAIV